MKRIFILVTLISVMLLVCACGTVKVDISAGENAGRNLTDVATASGYTVCFSDGKEITFGESALEKLGDYTDMSEAPSCVHEGFDRLYTYSGFTVTTSPDNEGVNFVTEVSIFSSEAVLEGGVTIGSTLDDVIGVFGEDYTESFGLIRYSLDGATASFVTTDNVVTGITFAAKTE